jgi:hypothetical protein
MFDEILRLLNTSAVLRDLQVIELIVYGQNALRTKLRAEVTDTLMFQVWLNHNSRHTRYAYQLFRGNRAILRWDNAPHHPEVAANFPHHFHNDSGQLHPSTLSGNPVTDLPFVLLEIQDYLQRLNQAL